MIYKDLKTEPIENAYPDGKHIHLEIDTKDENLRLVLTEFILDDNKCENRKVTIYLLSQKSKICQINIFDDK